MEGKKMMMQPSKEEYEICEKLKKCTDEKERKILEEKDVITDPKTPKSNRTIVMPDFLAVEMEDFISSLSIIFIHSVFALC